MIRGLRLRMPGRQLPASPSPALTANEAEPQLLKAERPGHVKAVPFRKASYQASTPASWSMPPLVASVSCPHSDFWNVVGTPEWAFKAGKNGYAKSAAGDSSDDEDEPIVRKSGEPVQLTRMHVNDLDAEMFRKEFVLRGNPVVLTGLVEQWPAWSKWSTDFFAEQYGTLPVSVDDGSGNRVDMTMADYIQALEKASDSESPPYLRLWYYRHSAPELKDDFLLPEFFADWFEKLPDKLRPNPLPRWIFIGPPNAHTPLHLDPWCTHAWFAQLRGRKRFVMFAPEDTTLVCNGKEFADPNDPDLSIFPQFHSARQLDFVLEPGEFLFLPAGWAHMVSTLPGEASVSLTENFLDKTNFGTLKMAFLMYKMQTVLGRKVKEDVEHPSSDEEKEKKQEQEHPAVISSMHPSDIESHVTGKQWLLALSASAALIVAAAMLYRRK